MQNVCTSLRSLTHKNNNNDNIAFLFMAFVFKQPKYLNGYSTILSNNQPTNEPNDHWHDDISFGHSCCFNTTVILAAYSHPLWMLVYSLLHRSVCFFLSLWTLNNWMWIFTQFLHWCSFFTVNIFAHKKLYVRVCTIHSLRHLSVSVFFWWVSSVGGFYLWLPPLDARFLLFTTILSSIAPMLA